MSDVDLVAREARLAELEADEHRLYEAQKEADRVWLDLYQRVRALREEIAEEKKRRAWLAQYEIDLKGAAPQETTK